MLMQRSDPGKDPRNDGIVYLLSSQADLPAEQLLQGKRRYWDIENGSHLRLDVSRWQEDKSRVRNRNAATNLALFRRAALSLARHWIAVQPNPRKATTNGFLGTMARRRYAMAFRIALSKQPSWLP